MTGDAWQLDVGAECNRLLELAENMKASAGKRGFFSVAYTHNCIVDILSIVQRVAEFEKLEEVKP
jgi:hypothetical protein